MDPVVHMLITRYKLDDKSARSVAEDLYGRRAKGTLNPNDDAFLQEAMQRYAQDQIRQMMVIGPQAVENAQRAKLYTNTGTGLRYAREPSWGPNVDPTTTRLPGPAEIPGYPVGRDSINEAPAGWGALSDNATDPSTGYNYVSPMGKRAR